MVNLPSCMKAGYHFKKTSWELELVGECATLVTLTAEDGSTIEKRLDEVLGETRTYSVELLYTVME